MRPRQVSAWMYGLGGRRFLMVMGAAAVNTALFATRIMSEAGYITLTLATIGAYLTANTAEGMTTIRNKK